jgi:dipeptidyl-peptidase III
LNRRIRPLILILAALLLIPTAFAQTRKAAAKPGTKSSLVERIDRQGFIQVEAGSFNDLSSRQKALAYWLSQASIAIDPINYDQNSRFGIRQKHVLEQIVGHAAGGDAAAMKKIEDFTKLFWANRGNHQDNTAQKFLPAFTYEELEAAGLQAIQNGANLGTPDDFRKELTDLRPSLFDPSFEPQMTAKSPQGGLDILQASSNNFYSGVSLEEMKSFAEKNPLNSRVVKRPDGTIVEEVWRAGTPDGSVPPGLYAQYLGKAIEFLQQAKPLAEPGQGEVIARLIKYYQTGDFRDWIAFGQAWVLNSPPVDFANGFIEVYRDARGQKGTSQSFVSITDEKLNKTMQKVAANAQYFEGKAPWLDIYKKQGVKPPLAKAVETVIETGDFAVTVVGDNLPNENEIRESIGTKSFLFTGSTRALAQASGTAVIEEFAATDAEKTLRKKYGSEASDLLTAMHEIIGHGSGKVSAKLDKAPETYLREYYSALEEGRADLVALWNVWDPKLKELGLVSDQEGVAKAMYYSAAAAPLTQLRSIPRGETIEEDHQRDRQMIVNYIRDKVPGAIDLVEHDGKHYMQVQDFQKMRKGVGMLLAELMRIKAEGDFDAIKSLIDTYGVHFDPALRDEVVARYKALNLPTYWSGINAELHPKLDDAGNVTSVSMTYPRNIKRQRLQYAAMYEPDLMPKDGAMATITTATPEATSTTSPSEPATTHKRVKKE